MTIVEIGVVELSVYSDEVSISLGGDNVAFLGVDDVEKLRDALNAFLAARPAGSQEQT